MIELNFLMYKSRKKIFNSGWLRYKYDDSILHSTTTEEKKGIKPKNYGKRLSVPQASLALNQLGKIDRYNTLRRDTAYLWDSWCEDNNIRRPIA